MKLDDLTLRKDAMTMEVIIATGYADSVGTEGYNATCRFVAQKQSRPT